MEEAIARRSIDPPLGEAIDSAVTTRPSTQPPAAGRLQGVRGRVKLAGVVGRAAYHVANERLTRPKPVTLRQVPPSPEALTTQWLTVALCDGAPGAAVTDFTLGPRNDGTSARRTVRVTYNDAGREAGLQEALFTKSAPSFLTRVVGSGAGLARVESSFYALVRPTLDIETPEVKYSAYDPVSHRQMLITDDVATTRGATFGTALGRTLTLEQAEQIVDTLATLHARFWRAPLRRMYGSWLENAYESFLTLDVAIGAEARIHSGFTRARDVIPADIYMRRGEFFGAMTRSQWLASSTGVQTFLHGDVHPGNWYVTGDGRLGVYDWQLSVQGTPARDLSYALSSHLPVEDRRRWEDGLLRRYLERVSEAGVADPPSFAELHQSYRQQLCYALFAWLATIGRGPLQPRYQPDEVSLANLERISQALSDLDTLDAVGS